MSEIFKSCQMTLTHVFPYLKGLGLSIASTFFQSSLRSIFLSSDKSLMVGLPQDGHEIGVWSVSPFGGNPVESDHFTLPHPTPVQSVAWSPVKCK
jgi:hypothetical protein